MKETLTLNVANNKSVMIVTGLSASGLAEYMPAPASIFAIVDKQVKEWFLKHFEGIKYIIVEADEQLKTMRTIENIAIRLLNEDVDRNSFLLAVGGGVICDITGFLASVYMRGVTFGYVPTTLLAQADAAYGGKNGVNVYGYKNILGTFTQPEFVLCCTEVFATLSDRVFNAGMAEIIKMALIADVAFFDYLEKHADAVAVRDEVALNEIIRHAVALKIAIVERDEREKGERRKLNLGHTVGHAIERSAKDIMHGEAVSIGIMCAARFSQRQGWLSIAAVERISALLQYFSLPVTCSIPANKLHEAILCDKKKNGSQLCYIALTSIGKAIEVTMETANCVNDIVIDT